MGLCTYERQRAKGMVTLEFTIVSTVLLILIFAIVEGGRYVYSYSAVAHAARQGARYAAVRGSNAAIDTRRDLDAPATEEQLITYIESKTSLNNIDVTVTWPLNADDTPNRDPGELVIVTVSYDFSSFLPLFPEKNISSTASNIIYF